VNGLRRIVAVGASHGAVEFAATLRQRGFDGSVLLVGEEPELPYQRPPLSKEFLKPDAEALPLKGEMFYGANAIDLKLGVRVESIDRQAREIVLSTGERIAYDHLLLSTGARNRVLPIPGLEPTKALELRTLTDARRLNGRLEGLRHVTVVGGGFIGLEVAALLRAKDIAVDVLEATPRLMGRVLSHHMSDYFLGFHKTLGTTLRLETLAQRITHRGDHDEITLSTGDTLRSDALLVAAGIVPNTELATAAGLATDNGVLVDDRLRTSDPAVSAIGDCAAYPNVYTGAVARLESVQNAVDQGRHVATRLMGEDKAYDGFPWFWSNQGTARLQIAGIAHAPDSTVVRGEPSSGKFSVFIYRSGKLVAVESLNQAGEHMLARRLLGQGLTVTPEQAVDLSLDLKSLLPRPSA